MLRVENPRLEKNEVLFKDVGPGTGSYRIRREQPKGTRYEQKGRNEIFLPTFFSREL